MPPAPVTPVSFVFVYSLIQSEPESKWFPYDTIVDYNRGGFTCYHYADVLLHSISPRLEFLLSLDEERKFSSAALVLFLFYCRFENHDIPATFTKNNFFNRVPHLPKKFINPVIFGYLFVQIIQKAWFNTGVF